MKVFEKALNRMFFLWRRKYIGWYLDRSNPYYKENELLYFNLFRRVPNIYFHCGPILNKCLLEDLKLAFPGFTYIHFFINSCPSSDPEFLAWSQCHFLICLNREGLMIEFDTHSTYSLYYKKKYEDTELQVVLTLLRKHQKTDWLWMYQHLRLN